MDFGNMKCVIVRTGRETVKQRGHYDAARYAWFSREGIAKFREADYVLHSVAGTIEKVFKPTQWFDDVNCKTPGFEVYEKYDGAYDPNKKGLPRVGFIGEEVTNKDITSRFVGQYFDQGKYPVYFSW